MSNLVSFLQDPVGGLAVAGVNLIVAIGLIAVSLALGVALSLLIGLPALVTEPCAVGAQLNSQAA
jgi:Na+/H+ antiporter NhaA